MQKVYESPFAVHEYEAGTGTLFSHWFKTTEHMNGEQFKAEMQAWLEVFRQCRPQYLYDQCSDFIYPISPDEQVWMARLLNAEWIELGLKKYAHMVPAEMIAQLSVEQLFDEFFNMKLPHQFPIVNFARREEALAWLYADPS